MPCRGLFRDIQTCALDLFARIGNSRVEQALASAAGVNRQQPPHVGDKALVLPQRPDLIHQAGTLIIAAHSAPSDLHILAACRRGLGKLSFANIIWVEN